MREDSNVEATDFRIAIPIWLGAYGFVGWAVWYIYSNWAEVLPLIWWQKILLVIFPCVFVFSVFLGTTIAIAMSIHDWILIRNREIVPKK